VYFLIGAEKHTTREVYVGESESVVERIQQHIDKEFWQEAIAFTSKDENLTKSHIKYLESRVVELAKEAGRYEVQNGPHPTLSGLPRPDKDAMEEFLGHLRLLLGALGHRLLKPLVEPAESKKVSDSFGRLTFSIKQAVAHGQVTDEGFVVFKGSTALAQINPSMGSYTTYKTELVATGKVLEKGDLLQFKENVLFTSPTAAAATISGSSVNGRMAWKDAQGRTLKELEEAQARTE
jgi:hypothetical protein